MVAAKCDNLIPERATKEVPATDQLLACILLMSLPAVKALVSFQVDCLYPGLKGVSR
jgi:hypothetical protein